MKIHVLKTTGEAIRNSIVNTDVNIGDLIIVPSEGITGVYALPWPFALTVNNGFLDELVSPSDFKLKLISSPQLIEAYILYSSAIKDEDGIHLLTSF